MPEGEIDGVTLQCGSMAVPQDRAKPAGEQVKIAFAVLKSHRRIPHLDALIHLHGGPGGGLLPFIETGAQVFDKMREDRDIVLFDQRGAGYSTPDLNCYNLEFELDEKQRELELPEGMNERQARTLASCAQAFAERGVDLTQYNTAENAKDVIDLASALGLKSFNLSGVSYGTRLAQEVMRSESSRIAQRPPGLVAVAGHQELRGFLHQGLGDAPGHLLGLRCRRRLQPGVPETCRAGRRRW